ncbi:MAG: AraC family transcriptional regulator [Paracoccaceae bacterium]
MLDPGQTGPSQSLTQGSLLVEGNDLDLACSAVSGVFVDHRLRAATSQPARPIQVAYKRFDAVALCYFDYGRELEIQPDMLDDFYLVQIPIQGWSTVRCGSASETTAPGLVSVLPAQREFSLRWSEDTQKVLLQVDRRRLTEKLEALLGAPLTRSPDFGLGACDIAGHGQPLRCAVEGLKSLTTMPDTPGTRHMAAAFEEAFMHALLFGVENDMSAAIHAGALSTACPRAVRLAEEYIEAHLCDPICIEDLVRVSGVSSRSLFDSFNRFRDMTPMRFVKFRRLHKVRAALMAAGDMDSVSSVAIEWGFNHLGRFARDYAKAFGESPSDTLRLARAAHGLIRH